jgi:pyrroline-5-carboxylate reductase
MDISEIERRGLVIIGCGKMGSALLAGWLAQGLAPNAVHIRDPKPSEWVMGLADQGVHINAPLPNAPAVILMAVKPQMMGDVLAEMGAQSDALILSVAAGTPLAMFEAAFGKNTPIIRTMPNTPAAIGRGITALIGNGAVTPAQMDLADGLMRAVGQTVRLTSEAQMDAVTAVSGSGPAYVFHLIETLAAAGVTEGLDPTTAMHLAKATVAGAGALAEQADQPPTTLRENVTSPGGTTAAALKVLMDTENGFPPLLARAVRAAANRGRELAG